MERKHAMILLIGATLSISATARSQQATSPDPDVIPAKMPYSTPYGAPIGAQRAQTLIRAAVADATRRGWAMNIAVYDSGAHLVAFLRMDGAQLASIAIAEHKARTAVVYRRATHVFEDAVDKSHYNYILSLDDVIASRGGIPLVDHGKIIGAIGCSGGTGSQDESICAAAATLVNDDKAGPPPR